MTTDIQLTPSGAHALRLHERVEGSGMVLIDAGISAPAWYRLKDVEELQRAGRADVRTDGRPGARTVFGLLRGPTAGLLVPHIGSRLRLRLADGRTLPFTIVKVIGDAYLIQGLGALQ